MSYYNTVLIYIFQSNYYSKCNPTAGVLLGISITKTRRMDRFRGGPKRATHPWQSLTCGYTAVSVISLFRCSINHVQPR